MKFLIQTIHNEIEHDFSFTLLQSIDYKNWYSKSKDYKKRFINSNYNADKNITYGKTLNKI